jgi:phosphoribosylamine--glycine ligase
MKILVIGSGGREHAIAWRLARSGHEVHSTPGNPGMARVGTNHPASDVLELAKHLGADLTVVGPEAPLAGGIVDRFRAAGLMIVGPTRENAQLEASKVFAKRFFLSHGIPTAKSRETASESEALDALREFQLPVVIKADGLAAGKGVIVASTKEEAVDAVQTLGTKLVIEEFLEGEEVSFIAICDGRSALALEPTQDHKRIFDLDQGPNTGGMGAYCDSRILSEEQRTAAMEQVILPTVRATGFTGFLYAGLMMTPQGAKVLEFNVRLGDPETQALMHRYHGDFAEPLLASARGELAGLRAEWNPDPSVCVVMASEGYPGTPRIGDLITGIDECEKTGAVVFHAGTRESSEGICTSGGRVLGVTASGPTLAKACAHAYNGVEQIRWLGAQFRRDIGQKGLVRWK